MKEKNKWKYILKRDTFVNDKNINILVTVEYQKK